MLIKKMAAGLTLFSLLLSLACTAGPCIKTDAASSSTTLASLNYSFSSASADAETDGTLNKIKYGSKKSGYRLNGIVNGALLFASVNGSDKRKLEWSSENDTYRDAGAGNRLLRQPVMTAGKKNPWKADTKPYFEIQIPTSGYQSISFSAYVGATKKGPKSYQLSYAAGNSNTFTPISGASLTLQENKEMSRIAATLPTAADNQKMLKIRIEITSLTSICGENMTTAQNSTSGEAAINHILISGTKQSSAAVPYKPSGSTSRQSSATVPNKPSGSTSKRTVKKITLNKKKVKLKKNQSLPLKVSVRVTPQTKANVKAVKAKLKWKSSNIKVAVVTKNGKIKAKKKGKATITVTYSKKIKATCKVTVQKASVSNG